MNEFATRDELNGLGARLNLTMERLAGIVSDSENSKQDRRDLWDAAGKGREEVDKVKTMVHNISTEVVRGTARMNIYFLVGNAVIVAIIVKFLNG